MNIIKGDPTYIHDKETYFMNIAKAIRSGSTHPMCPGACIITRDREIIGEGRSVLASCKIEIDCITYAIANAAKRGTPLTGAAVYTTRYPFSAAVFQLHIMGVNKIIVLAHDWEPYYKDEFRRAATLASELGISIEPYHDDKDESYRTSELAPKESDRKKEFKNKELYTSIPIEEESFDIETYTAESHETDFTL